jgi:hypothetical protein
VAVSTRPIPRYTCAGAASAAVWALAEIPLSRALGTGFTDVGLLARQSRLPGRAGTAAGLAAHIANGALFGAGFALAGGRGAAQGLAAAELEGTLLWPVVAVIDREHFTKRVFAQEVVTHALFGIVLGFVGQATSSPACDTPA